MIPLKFENIRKGEKKRKKENIAQNSYNSFILMLYYKCIIQMIYFAFRACHSATKIEKRKRIIKKEY